MIDWDNIDTVLLDMDGTLLDLAFDNWFWQRHVPEQYALSRNLPYAEAERILQDLSLLTYSEPPNQGKNPYAGLLLQKQNRR